jgi:hypothetical protein
MNRNTGVFYTDRKLKVHQLGSLIAKVFYKNHSNLADNFVEGFFYCRLANIAFLPPKKEIRNQENSESNKSRQEV